MSARIRTRCWGTVPLQNKRPSENGVYEVERPEFDEFAWFVGLFEGEGSIMARRGVSTSEKRYLRISIVMTDRDVVERAYRVVGRGGVDLHSGRSVRKDKGANRHPERWKPTYRWRLEGPAAASLVMRMLPYLGERRAARAREVLQLTGFLNEDQLQLEEAY